MYQNILVPVTDGKRVYNVSAPLKAAYENDCKEVVKAFMKQTVLYVIDDEWKEHLRQLDELRHSVQNASYEQKDPLLIYKLESFNLFEQMLQSLNKRALAILMRGQIPMREPSEVRQAQAPQRTDMSRYNMQKDQMGQASQGGRVQTAMSAAQGQDTRAQQKPMPLHVEKRPLPNDPCPCGSGKKFKKCHGAGL